MFYVGQKVVCVDDQPPLRWSPLWRSGEMDGLTKGRIYTVAKVGLSSWIDGRPCIRVVEIVRRPKNTPYWAHRFRPVIERKTDISVFTGMLDDVSEKSKESA